MTLRSFSGLVTCCTALAKQKLIPLLAYFIAFGPHGPRAEAPPGEGVKVFKGVAVALIISSLLFFGVRSAAGPPPKTMSKEWQEATNEYLKVTNHDQPHDLSDMNQRNKNPNPSLVSPLRATVALVTSRASPVESLWARKTSKGKALGWCIVGLKYSLRLRLSIGEIASLYRSSF